MGWGRHWSRPAWHRTPSRCRRGPTLLSRRSLLSRSSLRSFSTFSSLLFSCWISSCNRAGGEGGGRRKGKRLAGRSLAGLRNPPSLPPPALGGQGGGSPGRRPLSPAKGWAGTFPNPLRRRADSNPINGVETPGSPGKAREGSPHPSGERVGANPPIGISPKGLGAPSAGGEGGGNTGMPTDHQPAPGRRARPPASSTSFSPLLRSQYKLGGAGGGSGAPTLGAHSQRVGVKAEPGSSSVPGGLGGGTSVWLPAWRGAPAYASRHTVSFPFSTPCNWAHATAGSRDANDMLIRKLGSNLSLALTGRGAAAVLHLTPLWAP